MFALVLTTALAAGQPPLIVNAQVGKDDVLVAKIVQTVQVPVTREEKVTVNGREETRQVTVIETVQQMHERRWSLKGATVTTADGKKVEIERLRKLLDKPRPVFVSTTGKPLEAAYLKVLDPGAIVIVAKEAAPALTPAPAVTAPVK